MENSIIPQSVMMFNPSGYGLNIGQTDVVNNLVVDSIGLLNLPPNMAGPYLPEDSSTISDVYGMWLGPAPDEGGFSIEFSVVGPYPPAEGVRSGEAARASTTTATTTEPDASMAPPKSVKWSRVKFAALSLDELKCAERQLKEAQDRWKDNHQALELLDAWLKEVADAKKKYELEGQGGQGSS
ncbi:hypothetical protein AYO21_08754 [Fonsecaea monophora]|uniref:Uncharacterized protein n=1 Tax=Fonsecaea monophora TaxID=254056 RepID=A0A177EY81_9EURO|nr:hypothetical protein AYO21_08754 [Fonsecaea monophora]KAH0843056.1 hypothetical protein FOPE_08296 [Fonsecaea pedrosoi]OAG37003.1 hypothetical protein AYO21_08754 [Fonsecaea monophora]